LLVAGRKKSELPGRVSWQARCRTKRGFVRGKERERERERERS
jgi:hypothetical protein